MAKTAAAPTLAISLLLGLKAQTPPRSPVTGSEVLPGIDKCFQKYWPNTVHYFPIPGNLTTGSGQDMGSQVGNMYLGQKAENKKALSSFLELSAFFNLVPPARIERATPGLGILCSIP